MARHFLLYHSRASYRTNKRWVNFLFPLILCSEQKKIRSNICVSSRFQLDKYTQLEPHSHTRHSNIILVVDYLFEWLPAFDLINHNCFWMCTIAQVVQFGTPTAAQPMMYCDYYYFERVACVSMQREMSIQITSPFMCSVYYLRYYFFFCSLLVALESHCSRLCGAFSLLCRLFQES